MHLWKQFTSPKVDPVWFSVKLSNVRLKNKTCVIYNSLTNAMSTNHFLGILYCNAFDKNVFVFEKFSVQALYANREFILRNDLLRVFLFFLVSRQQKFQLDVSSLVRTVSLQGHLIDISAGYPLQNLFLVLFTFAYTKAQMISCISSKDSHTPRAPGAQVILDCVGNLTSDHLSQII